MSGEARRRRVRELLRRCGLADVDPAAFDTAFVHESAAREGAGASNERLEFLGDAILGFVTASYLYARYPEAREGELSRRKNALVSGDRCARTARRLAFGEVLVLGNGMRGSNGADNTSILADAFEAFVAALHAASDLETVRGFLEREHLADAAGDSFEVVDAKTALQELAQAHLGATPVYFERAEGPPQERRFTAYVRIGDEIVGEGIGPSKKAAQLSAAAVALAAVRARVPAEALAAAASNDAPSDDAGSRVIAFRARRKPKAPHPKAPR